MFLVPLCPPVIKSVSGFYPPISSNRVFPVEKLAHHIDFVSRIMPFNIHLSEILTCTCVFFIIDAGDGPYPDAFYRSKMK
jgi:hypothetical protein